jgi:hypothetical protein
MLSKIKSNRKNRFNVSNETAEATPPPPPPRLHDNRYSVSADSFNDTDKIFA